MRPFDVKKVRELMRRFDKKSGRFRVVDRDEAAGILRAAGRRPVSILAVTEKLPSDDPLKDKAFAVKLRTMKLNVSYEEAVAAETGEPFKAGPRSWGDQIGLPFVYHKDKFYLSGHIQKTHAGLYFDKRTKAPIEGVAVPKEDRSEEPVCYRNYKWDGVLAFRVGRNAYLVKETSQ